MKKFEYKVEIVSNDDMIEDTVAKFNSFGAEGWQIIQMFLSGFGTRVWLMREVPE